MVNYLLVNQKDLFGLNLHYSAASYFPSARRKTLLSKTSFSLVMLKGGK